MHMKLVLLALLTQSAGITAMNAMNPGEVLIEKGSHITPAGKDSGSAILDQPLLDSSHSQQFGQKKSFDDTEKRILLNFKKKYKAALSFVQANWGTELLRVNLQERDVEKNKTYLQLIAELTLIDKTVIELFDLLIKAQVDFFTEIPQAVTKACKGKTAFTDILARWESTQLLTIKKAASVETAKPSEQVDLSKENKKPADETIEQPGTTPQPEVILSVHNPGEGEDGKLPTPVIVTLVTTPAAAGNQEEDDDEPSKDPNPSIQRDGEDQSQSVKELKSKTVRRALYFTEEPQAAAEKAQPAEPITPPVVTIAKTQFKENAELKVIKANPTGWTLRKSAPLAVAAMTVVLGAIFIVKSQQTRSKAKY